jgi:hypothetical protein
LGRHPKPRVYEYGVRTAWLIPCPFGELTLTVRPTSLRPNTAGTAIPWAMPLAGSPASGGGRIPHREDDCQDEHLHRRREAGQVRHRADAPHALPPDRAHTPPLGQQLLFLTLR